MSVSWSALLPYEAIAPAGKAETMIIALPGAGETAKIYCDVFSAGRYRRLARQRGHLLVCLSSYGLPLRAENFEPRLVALRDELVRTHPHVNKVFLAGYSIGGRSALLIGLRHPEKFDGIVAIVPWLRLPGDRTKLLPEIVHRLKTYPHEVFVACAVFDFFFPISIRDQDKLVEASEGSLHRHRYWSDHWFVVAVSARDVFNFIDRQPPVAARRALTAAESIGAIN